MAFLQILSYFIALRSVVTEICELLRTPTVTITFKGVAGWRIGATLQK